MGQAVVPMGRRQKLGRVYPYATGSTKAASTAVEALCERGIRRKAVLKQKPPEVISGLGFDLVRVSVVVKDCDLVGVSHGCGTFWVLFSDRGFARDHHGA